jgi:Ala-tRNA(Pro) deacylase
LATKKVPFDTLFHPPAYNAHKLAKYLRVPGKRVAKCVLLVSPAGPVLAVLPATHQVDPAAVARELGGTFRLAEEREVAAVFRDCEWGALVPFGTLYGLPTILDEAVDPDTEIVFEAHGHAVAIRMRCRDFERLERPRRCRFARHRGRTGPAGPAVTAS